MVHGSNLDSRSWRAFVLIAEQGVLDTAQVATVLGVSRPTAHRVLTDLYLRGLLVREHWPHGSERRWYYSPSAEAAPLLLRVLVDRGRQTSLSLWERRRDHTRQYMINQFFVDLVDHARRDGQAELYRWWHWFDARRWLAEHGVPAAGCDGHGIWIEQGRPVRFTVHWAFDPRCPLDELPEPTEVLDGYTGPAPVDVVLVVAKDAVQEMALHAYLSNHPVPVPVATTTTTLLSADGHSPAEAVWAPTRPHTPESPRHRLVELAADR